MKEGSMVGQKQKQIEEDQVRNGDVMGRINSEGSCSVYDESQVQLKWTSVRKVGAGYHNLGNTCYMNSVLQVLVHTPPLAELFLSKQHPPKNPNKQNRNSGGCDLDRRLHVVLNHAFKTAKLAPNPIAKILPQINKFFKPGRQQDAHEFLVCFLDKIHEQFTGTCLNSKNKKNQQKNNINNNSKNLIQENQKSGLNQQCIQNGFNLNSNSNSNFGGGSSSSSSQGIQIQNGFIQSQNQQFHQNDSNSNLVNPNINLNSILNNGLKNLDSHQKQNNSINSNFKQDEKSEYDDSYIRRIFGGKFHSEIKCLNVNYKSETSEQFLTISLEILRINDVQFSLRNFVKEEILDGQNKYKCPINNKFEKAVKKYNISEPPNILILQLKRFQFGHIGRKLDHHVKFEQNLNLGPYIIQKNNNNNNSNHNYNLRQLNQEYELYGVVVHLGMSLHGGHYISYIKSSNGKWYCMDDDSVHPVHIEHVLRQKAYILFYIRKQPRSWLIGKKNQFINQKQDLQTSKNGGQFEKNFGLENNQKNSIQQNGQIERVVQLSENLNLSQVAKNQSQLFQNGEFSNGEQSMVSFEKQQQKNAQCMHMQQNQAQQSCQVNEQPDLSQQQQKQQEQQIVLLRRINVEKNTHDIIGQDNRQQILQQSKKLSNNSNNKNINQNNFGVQNNSLNQKQLQMQNQNGLEEVVVSGDVQLHVAGRSSKEAAQLSGLSDVGKRLQNCKDGQDKKLKGSGVGHKRNRSAKLEGMFDTIVTTATTKMNQIIKFSPTINKLRKISGSSFSTLKKRKLGYLNDDSEDDVLEEEEKNTIQERVVVGDEDKFLSDVEKEEDEEEEKEEEEEIFGLDDAIQEFQEWEATPPISGRPQHAPWSGKLSKLEKQLNNDQHQLTQKSQVNNYQDQTQQRKVSLKSQCPQQEQQQLKLEKTNQQIEKTNQKIENSVIASGKQAEEFLLGAGSGGPATWSAVDGKKLLQIHQQQLKQQKRRGIISNMKTERVRYDEEYDRGKQKKIKLNNKNSILSFTENGNLFQKSYDETQKRQ